MDKVNSVDKLTFIMQMNEFLYIFLQFFGRAIPNSVETFCFVPKNKDQSSAQLSKKRQRPPTTEVKGLIPGVEHLIARGRRSSSLLRVIWIFSVAIEGD